MERISVDSSNISEVGWENGILEIEFSSGRIYEYFDVSYEIYEAMMQSPGIGEYFHEHIKNSFKYSRIS